ncbi:MiAMP1 family antimicrobial peptide [Embleya sp. NPDC020630]|uniref:MiAMP1 family antimicrobial peptide n=1 Tax=Embleya sp. NPDC020630 TaxID=3363979 RepID=UPI0037A944E2
MRKHGRTRTAFVAVATTALLTASTVTAFASRFESYSGRNYTGSASTTDACGCSNIPYAGSYIFEYGGQTARVYKQKNCRGVADHDLTGNERDGGTVHGWKSIFILC